LVGYAVGSGTPKGPIYKTTDGGISWTGQTSGAPDDLNDVFFTNALVGYANGGSFVLKTINGGATWNSTTAPVPTGYTSIFCTGPNTCYIGGTTLHKTTDGGNTWNKLSLPSLSVPNVYYIMSFSFTDLQTGYAVGAIYDTAASSVVNGVILKTKNAGQSWYNINTAANNTALQNNPLSTVHFFDSQTGYAAGGGSGNGGVVVRTTNGGTAACNLSLTVTTTNAACGLSTGTASVVAAGGTAPYTYAWTNGDKTPLADSLHANLYMVLVTDASGCTETKLALVVDAGSPTITVTSTTNVSCHGGNNGAIDISVSGGSPPYGYMWVNGASTQDISNLSAGAYQVGVFGNNGCVAMANIVVLEPAPVSASVTITNASCGSANGSAVVAASGGTAPYTYQWNTSPVQSTQTATGLAAGGYIVTVTDKNGCSKSAMAPIVNLGAANAVLDSVVPADCASGKGSIYITVSGGSPPYTYLWFDGLGNFISSAQDLVGVPSGNYALTIASNGNPCTGAFMGIVPHHLPAAPVICMVDVDTLTGKNICIFEKDSLVNLGIDHYNFYRESIVAGQYQLLGSKLATLPSKWADQSANPLQHAWRYKISAVDTCGNESPLSSYHKTIHLAANIGLNNVVNLAWDDYEGLSYGTFIIYRYTTASGKFDSLDAVNGNVHAYTDLNPPVPLVNVFYYVAVENLSGCKVSIKYPDPMTSNLNLSKSNINRINPSGIVSWSDLASFVHVYPNPTNGVFTVKSEKIKMKNAEVYNLFGELVFVTTLNGNQETVNLNLENGIYFLKIRSEEGVVTKKIIINK
jgi:photosystem II stability/assembly factor-like uncharacterized protein